MAVLDLDAVLQQEAEAPKRRVKDARAARFDLDYDQEKQNIEEHDEANGVPLSDNRPELPPAPREDPELPVDTDTTDED